MLKKNDIALVQISIILLMTFNAVHADDNLASSFKNGKIYQEQHFVKIT